MASTEERNGVSFRKLAWAGVIFTALASAGVWLAYARLVHYRRCAVEHLPPETELVARLDVEQVVLFEPVRRHLIPLIDRLPLGPAPAAANAEAEPRIRRLRREAGLNLGLDLREVLVATAPGGRWVLVLGGLFQQGLVPAIAHELRGEAATGWQRAGDALEFTPSGAALAQAADGALLLASDRALLEATLPSSTRFRELGLKREGAGSAVIPGALLDRWAAEGEGPQWLGTIESAALDLRLSREIEVDVRLGLRDGASAAAWVAVAGHPPPAASPPGTIDSSAGGLDPWGFLARARVPQVSGTTFQFVSVWRQTELDRAARDFAAWLERRLSASASTPS
jgi:hypothetical protein